nr:hypothetical protein CFP56_72174 [Quercus suber]
MCCLLLFRLHASVSYIRLPIGFILNHHKCLHSASGVWLIYGAPFVLLTIFIILLQQSFPAPKVSNEVPAQGCCDCPQRFDGITIDLELDWKFDDILSELNSLQIKLYLSAPKFAKTGPRDFSNRSCKPFTMRVSVDENDDDTESEVEEYGSLSDGESTFENQCSYLTDKEGIVGTALHELSHENHLQVKCFD